MPKLFPDIARIQYRYSDQYSFTSITNQAHRVFSGNGLFDVDITGGGHQPTGFDQWANFYQVYCTKSSKIKATFTCATTAVPATCYVFPVVLNAGNVTSLNWKETPYVRYKHMANGTGGPAVVTIKNSMNTTKMIGKPVSIFNNENAWAPNTGNPAEGFLWIVGIQLDDINSALISDTYFVECNLSYDTLHSRRLQFAES